MQDDEYGYISKKWFFFGANMNTIVMMSEYILDECNYFKKICTYFINMGFASKTLNQKQLCN